jgi:DNA-binding MarR family transcriptional regulator
MEITIADTTVVGTIEAVETPVKPQGCTNLKLRQLGRVVTRHYDAYLSASGIKNTQYSLLSHVAVLGPIRPSDLAHRMGLGWLKLGPGDDARSRLIEATKEGHAKRSEAKREWKRAQLALNARLGAEQVAALHSVIESCMHDLTESADAIVND